MSPIIFTYVKFTIIYYLIHSIFCCISYTYFAYLATQRFVWIWSWWLI